jgi:quercetin dioxygenase-like cupin family protein
MHARTRRIGAIGLVAVAIPAAAAGGYAVAAGQPTRSDLATAKNPVGGKGRTLGLTRVTIPAGAQLAAHTHPGTEIARIEQGTLTYTVERDGSVPVYRGDAGSARRLRVIRPGQTARLRAGDWIVEQPGMVHHAANNTGGRVVILLSSLFPNGAPPSTPAS